MRDRSVTVVTKSYLAHQPAQHLGAGLPLRAVTFLTDFLVTFLPRRPEEGLPYRHLAGGGGLGEAQRRQPITRLRLQQRLRLPHHLPDAQQNW
eukprot:762858-Prorocentrum_minimum.AAC.1